MAKLSKSFFAMVIMYIAINAIAPSYGEIAPQPAEDDDIAVAPSRVNADLENCAKGFTKTCGPQVFEGVFKNTTVTAPCCKNLVLVGKPCHDRLVKIILDLPWMKVQVKVPQILSQSEQIWSKCVSVGVAVSSTSPSPSSSEDDTS